MEAFTNSDAVAARLNRTFTSAEDEWVTTLLVDASAYLRSVIGQDVYPVTTSTFTAWPDAGRVDLPQYPVVSVDAVERDDVAVEYTYRPGYVTVSCDDPVDVTFTWGVDTAPEILVSLSAVLVSQAIMSVETGTGLTFGGLSSIALDDFRAAFADGGASSGMVLPVPQQKLIRRQFGRGDVDVVETR
ncbi:hypothetical protein [Microbacterium sp. NPDC055455]